MFTKVILAGSKVFNALNGEFIATLGNRWHFLDRIQAYPVNTSIREEPTIYHGFLDNEGIFHEASEGPDYYLVS